MTRRVIFTAMAILFITAVGLGDTEIVARYNAGASGNPVPDPTSLDGGSWKGRGPSSTASAVSDDMGLDLNAWKIRDRSEQPRGGRAYYISVTNDQIARANTHGWRLHARLRMVDDFNDTMSQVVVYDNGTRRWVLFFDLDGNGDLVVTQQHSEKFMTHRLTSGGTGHNAFHDFELVFNPTTMTADFFFDEKLIKKGDAGRSSPFTNKEVVFGTGSSPGQGEANWNLVEFEILYASADTTGPEGPVLEVPVDNKIMAQLNHPTHPEGFKWRFGWKDALDRESGILQYKIVLRRSGNLITEQIVPTTEYIHESREMLEEGILKNWSWQVQAQDEAGNWGKWSKTRSFEVESVHPSPPEIISPKSPEEPVIGQEWKFDWTDVTHSNGIKQYEIRILRPSIFGEVLVIKKNVTESQFIYESSETIDERYLKNWKWSVRVQNNAGKWSKTVSEKFDVATAPKPEPQPGIVLEFPEDEARLSQGYDSSFPDGYIWNFSWKPLSDPGLVKHYEFRITNTRLDKPYLHETLTQPNFTFKISKPIKDTRLEGWGWQVRAHYRDGTEGDWNTRKFSVAKYIPNTTIEGTVVDTSGNILAGVTVTETVSGKTALSGADGSFSISDLTPDTQAILTFNKEGYSSLTFDLNLRLGSNPVSAKLYPAAELICTVTDQSGNPVQGASVEVAGRQKTAETSEDGTCTISNLPVNIESEIIVSRVGYQTQRKPITLNSGPNPLSVAIPAYAYITGFVTDASEQPIDGVTVMVEGTGKSFTTYEDGYYKIQYFVPGIQVTVAFSKDGYWSKRELVTLQYGANLLPMVRLDLPASVSGTITDAAGNELNDVTVTETVSGESDLSKGKGSYSITGLAPNTQATITFSKDGYETKQESITLNPGDNSLPVALDRLAYISGRVMWADGLSFEGVTVAVEAIGKSVSTGGGGAYKLQYFTPGTRVTVTFRNDGYCSKSQDITLHPGDNPLPLVFLDSCASVSGTVYDSTGTGMKDVVVTIEGTTMSAQTDEKGKYKISELTPNTQVTLIFNKEGYADESRTITLNLSNNNQSATLYSLTSVSGTVKSQRTGNAIEDAQVMVEGTKISTSTGNDGSYVLSEVKAGTPVRIRFSHTNYLPKILIPTLKTGNNSLSPVSLIPKIERTTLSRQSVSGYNLPEIVISVSDSFWEGLEYKVVGEWQGTSDSLVVIPSIISDYERNKKYFEVYVRTHSSEKNIVLYKREKRSGFWRSWSFVVRNRTSPKTKQNFFEIRFLRDTGLTVY